MPRRPSLSLRRETLTELAAGDLARVAGGVPPTRDCPTAGPVCFTGLIVDAVSERLCTLIDIEP